MSNLMPKADKPERQQPAQTTGEPEEIALGQTATGEGYVRLRVRYDRGALSVVGFKEVPGPLLPTGSLEDGFLYEVTRAGRRLNVETIADLGVERSFPPPEGQETGDVRGHHITELETYEFNVRIPASEFTRRNLRTIQITLYETTEMSGPRQIDARSLKTQFGNQLREMGRLRGIDLQKLPEDLRRRMESSLR